MTAPTRTNVCPKCVKKTRLSSLAYGVLCIKKRLIYFTNDVETSRHECKFDMFALDLDRPRRLANCKLYTKFCSQRLPKKTYFAPKYSFVVNVLTVGYAKISANVNYVLKPVLQV